LDGIGLGDTLFGFFNVLLGKVEPSFGNSPWIGSVAEGEGDGIDYA